MTTLRKSVIVPHARETMFELVERCERYPEFLPWCAGAEVFERTPEVTRARLDISFRGLKTHITTLNRKRFPEAIGLEFVDGPFRDFGGEWRFTALGAEGCRVELSMDYTFRSATLAAMLGPLFGYIMETLVDRFVARAAETDA
jgi:ribosome-associated toxin RatA of RatAB toxin-antitoxin module